MIYHCYLSIILILICIFDGNYSFNIEKQKLYEVDILQTAIKREESSVPVTDMTSLYDEEYSSTLPQVEEEIVSEKIPIDENSTLPQVEEEIVSEKIPVDENSTLLQVEEEIVSEKIPVDENSADIKEVLKLMQSGSSFIKESSVPITHMTSMDDEEYSSTLPQIEENVSEKIPVDEKSTDIKELLKLMQSGSCLLKEKGWWTYKICFGRYIEQFHVEDGRIASYVIALGLYNSDYDGSNDVDQEKFKHGKQWYYSQYYANGTECGYYGSVRTGQLRSTEVRLYCEEDAGDYIYQIDEPVTCNYVITVHTSRLCSHPQ